MLISCPSSGISDYPQKPWFPLVTTIELRDHILGARGISCSWDCHVSRPFQWPETDWPRFCFISSYCPHWLRSEHALVLAHCATKRNRAGNSCWGSRHCLCCSPCLSRTPPNTSAHSLCPSGLYSNVACSVSTSWTPHPTQNTDPLPSPIFFTPLPCLSFLPAQYYVTYLLIFCLPSIYSLEWTVQKGRDFCLFCSELYPWHLEQGLAQSSCLVNSCLRNELQDFPGGAVDKESACQCRGHGFEPWSRKIPHAAEQLSPRATTKTRCNQIN